MKIIIQQKQFPGRAAFTLIEVMCGMAILGSVVVALYGGISSGFSVLSAARENLRATQVMVEKLETIRLYNWDQLNNLNFTMQTNFTEYYNYKDTNYGLTYQMALAIENSGLTETYAPQMRKITVTVNWTSLSGTPRNRSMTTFYTQNGLQAYAF